MSRPADMLRTSSPLRLAILRALVVGLIAVPPALGLSYVFRWIGPHPLQVLAIVVHGALGLAAASLAERWAIRHDRPLRGGLIAGLAAFVALVVGLIEGTLVAEDLQLLLWKFRYRPDRTLRTVGAVLVLFAVAWALPVAMLTYERVHPRDPLVLMLGPALTCGVALPALVTLAFAYGIAGLFDDTFRGAPSPPARAPVTTTTRTALLRGLGPVLLLSPFALLAFANARSTAFVAGIVAALAAGVAAAAMLEAAAARHGRPLLGAFGVAAVTTLSMPVAAAQGFYAAGLVAGGTDRAFADLGQLMTGGRLHDLPLALVVTFFCWGVPCAIVTYRRARRTPAEETNLPTVIAFVIGPALCLGLALITLACRLGDALDRRLGREDMA